MIITRAAFEITKEERDQTIQRLIETSYPGSHFFLMILSSSAIAAVGLALNNVAIIIGSMLVAPFLSPVLSLSLGIVLADFVAIRRSFGIIAKSALLAVIVATILAPFLPIPSGFNEEILSRNAASLPYLYVALFAGIAASFAIVRENLAESVVGVAVSVALLPPLATVGIGFATFQWSIILGAFQLFLVNLLGIVFAGVAIFSLMGFYPERQKVEQELALERKKLAEEQQISKSPEKSAEK